MKIIGVIPARFASTRFPGKPLALIAGRPLIQHVVEQCQKAGSLQEVVVATDDERIRETAQRFCRVEMTPPDCPSGTDRIAAVVQRCDCEAAVNIQGDEPLIDPAVIDALAQSLLSNPDWSMATVACPITNARDLEARSVVKVVVDRDGGALYFSRLPIPCTRDGSPDLTSGLYLRHIGIYAYRGAFLKRLVQEPPCKLEQTEKLEQLRAMYVGGRIAVIVATDTGVGVDTPEDVGYVEAALRKNSEFRIQ